MIRTLRVLSGILAAALLAAACGPSDSQAGAVPTSVTPPPARPAPASAPVGDPDELRREATRLWQARVDENWPVAFRYEDTRDYPELTEDDFIKWSSEEEPFRYLGFDLGRVIVERDLGWVEVTSNTGMRKFPKLEPRETTRWEKWRLVDGSWKLVPRERLEEIPESPAVRDAEAESALAERFEQSWVIRHNKDWNALYQMLDPEDRPDEPDKPPFLPLEFIDREVLWVQAIGNSGTVRVEILQRIDDPSMTKLEPNRVVKNEKWVRRDGTWYLDLSNQE